MNQVVQALAGSPTILVGHSLGAALCLEAARRCPVEGLVLCAMPWFAGERPPRVPEGTGLSLSALARVGLFLREASLRVPDVRVETLCYVGDSDPCCTDESRRSLPFQIRVIPGADHDLAGSERFRAGLTGVTFSIDSSDPGEFARLRDGADLATVVAHLGGPPLASRARSSPPSCVARCTFAPSGARVISWAALRIIDIAWHHGAFSWWALTAASLLVIVPRR